MKYTWGEWPQEDSPKSTAFVTKKPLLFDTNCWENWKTTWERVGSGQHLTPYTKINSECVNDLNIKKETIIKWTQNNIPVKYLEKDHDFMTKQELEKNYKK